MCVLLPNNDILFGVIRHEVELNQLNVHAALKCMYRVAQKKYLYDVSNSL